jgi:hypothetical protein
MSVGFAWVERVKSSGIRADDKKSFKQLGVGAPQAGDRRYSGLDTFYMIGTLRYSRSDFDFN